MPAHIPSRSPRHDASARPASPPPDGEIADIRDAAQRDSPHTGLDRSPGGGDPRRRTPTDVIERDHALNMLRFVVAAETYRLTGRLPGDEPLTRAR